jgi:hypothetical protein
MQDDETKLVEFPHGFSLPVQKGTSMEKLLALGCELNRSVGLKASAEMLSRKTLLLAYRSLTDVSR